MCIGKAALSHSAGTRSVEDRLDEHLRKMVKPKAKLFADEATFKGSLPVREFTDAKTQVGQVSVLHQHPYWVKEEDLQAYAKALAFPETGETRRQLTYISAPTGYGKSASILPAFLETAGQQVGSPTHYLYLPFHNNDSRHYFAKGTCEQKSAQVAGAAFILESITMLLDNKWPVNGLEIHVPAETVDIYLISDKLRAVLKDQLGADANPLIHLDEHRRMTGKGNASLTAWDREFRLGAFHCLALLGGRVRLIATYTSPPSEVEALSTGVCRDPVALPCLDPVEMMKDVTELQLAVPVVDAEERRMYATMLFRLAMKVQVDGLKGALHYRKLYPVPFLKEFREKADAFASAVGKGQRLEALRGCLRVCATSRAIKVGYVHSSNACELLLGIPDEDMEKLETQESDLVVLPNKKVSASLLRLLDLYDRKTPIYALGAHHFYEKAFGIADSSLVASAPLEAAYAWTIGVYLGRLRRIKFAGVTFSVDDVVCITGGRLFPTSDIKKPEVKAVTALRKDTLYFATEKVDGHATHPRVDLWFRSREDEVVLIDIAGGQNEESVTRKVENLENLIETWSGMAELKGLTFRGVVIAPSMPTIDRGKAGHVLRVFGKEARELLGGLDQVFRWLDPSI